MSCKSHPRFVIDFCSRAVDSPSRIGHDTSDAPMFDFWTPWSLARCFLSRHADVIVVHACQTLRRRRRIVGGQPQDDYEVWDRHGLATFRVSPPPPDQNSDGPATMPVRFLELAGRAIKPRPPTSSPRPWQGIIFGGRGQVVPPAITKQITRTITNKSRKSSPTYF